MDTHNSLQTVHLPISNILFHKKTSYHIQQHSITTTFKAMLHTSKWSREAEINLYDLIRNMSLTFHPLPGVPPVEGEVGAWLHVAETLPPSPLRIPALLPASIISYEDSIKYLIFLYLSMYQSHIRFYWVVQFISSVHDIYFLLNWHMDNSNVIKSI